MTDSPTSVPKAAAPHQLVELIFERTQVPHRYLRPVEVGAAYYDLSRVERAVDPEAQSEEELLNAAARRTWEPLGAVYLLEHTRQTLRWSNSQTPAAYHVGRVPEAAAYRIMGREHEYTFSELVEHLAQGPAAFRGYPIGAQQGSELRLQFTPPLPGEEKSESGEWESCSKWLRAGLEDVREGVHYQRYDEVSEDGTPVGTSYIGQRVAEGEWLSESGSISSISKWLIRPGVATGANF